MKEWRKHSTNHTNRKIRTIRVKKAPLFKKAPPPPPLLRSKFWGFGGPAAGEKILGSKSPKTSKKHVFGVGKKSDFQIFGVLKKAPPPPPLLGTKIFKGGGLS